MDKNTDKILEMPKGKKIATKLREFKGDLKGFTGNKILKGWAWGLWGMGVFSTAVLHHAGAWSETVGIVVMSILCVGCIGCEISKEEGDRRC